MHGLARLASTALIAASASHVPAAEMALHVGALKGEVDRDVTYSWALEYRHPISDHFSGSFIWLNEGHVDGHHRDGQAVQLWWHGAPVNRGAVFEAGGVGPYYYYDTVSAPTVDGYANLHGWAALFAVGMKWHFNANHYMSLRLNRVESRGDLDSTSLVAGIGYRFDGGSGSSYPAMAFVNTEARRWELDANSALPSPTTSCQSRTWQKPSAYAIRSTSILARA